MFSFTLVVRQGTVYRVVCMYCDILSNIIMCFQKIWVHFLNIFCFIGFLSYKLSRESIQDGEFVRIRRKRIKRKICKQKDWQYFIPTGYLAPSVRQSYHNHPYGPIPCRGWEDGSRMLNTPKRFNDWYWITVLVGFYSQTLNILLMTVNFWSCDSAFRKNT